MRARLGFVALLAVIAVMFTALGSRADESRTSSLSWLRMPGADSCVATQSLARAVEERLGRPVFVSASAADVSVEGRIEKRPGGGFRAVITIRDAKGALLGTRQLERRDGTCESMNAELALVIAVMIDPDAAMRPRPEDAGTATADAAPVPVAPVDAAPVATTVKIEEKPPVTAVEPAEADRWRVSAAANVATSVGLAPHATLGAGAEWMLLFPKVPLALRGYANVFYPTTAIDGQARATYDLLYVGGSLCPVLRNREVDLFACASTQIGGLRARDAAGGVAEEVLPLVNVAAEGRLAVRLLGPLELSAGIAAVLPLARPKSTFAAAAGGTSTLLELSPLAFTADIGLGVSLYP